MKRSSLSLIIGLVMLLGGINQGVSQQPQPFAPQQPIWSTPYQQPQPFAPQQPIWSTPYQQPQPFAPQQPNWDQIMMMSKGWQEWIRRNIGGFLPGVSDGCFGTDGNLVSNGFPMKIDEMIYRCKEGDWCKEDEKCKKEELVQQSADNEPGSKK